jgi:hypothetical protein
MAGGNSGEDFMTHKVALAFGIGASFLLAAGSASAAGTCATEVQALQQQLGTTSSTDVGASTGTTMDNDQTATNENGTSAVPPTAPSAGGGNAADGTNPMAAGTADSSGSPGVDQPATTGSGTVAEGPSSSTTTVPGVGTGNAADGTNPMAAGTADATNPSAEQPTTTGTMAQSSGTPTTTTPGVGTGNAADGTNPMAAGTADPIKSGDSTISPTITETSRAGTMNTTAGGRAAALASLESAQRYADAGQEDACMAELGNAKQSLGMQ